MQVLVVKYQVMSSTPAGEGYRLEQIIITKDTEEEAEAYCKAFPSDYIDLCLWIRKVWVKP